MLESHKRKWSVLITLLAVALLGTAGSVSAQKYGGTLVIATQEGKMGFDPAGDGQQNWGGHGSHDNLITADVTKGP